MKSRAAAVASVPFLAGCTTVQGYFPGSTVVVVDGTEYMVKKMSTSSGNSYVAAPNRPTGSSLMWIDPAIYAGNVRAIEKVSGCKIAPGSAQNTDNVTRAAVNC